MRLPSCLFVLLAFFLLLSLPSAQARTEEEVNNYITQTIIPDFQVSNVSAADALAVLQTQVSLNRYGIYFNLASKGKLARTPVTLHLSNVSARDIIATICAAAKVQFAVKKDQILIFEPWKVQQ